jgi:hypothetical protein
VAGADGRPVSGSGGFFAGLADLPARPGGILRLWLGVLAG